ARHSTRFGTPPEPDTEWPADRGGAQRHHHCVPGSCAFAKYAVAFFKMSRSIRASASSRFSRDTSASSSVTGRQVSPSPASRPCRARNTQFASVLPDMASRLAASGVVNSCSSTSRTACSRNSFVYFCRGNRSMPHLQTADHRLKASTFSSLAHSLLIAATRNRDHCRLRYRDHMQPSHDNAARILERHTLSFYPE